MRVIVMAFLLYLSGMAITAVDFARMFINRFRFKDEYRR